MWGIVIIVAACCLAFGAVDAAEKIRIRKQQEEPPCKEGLDDSNPDQ